MCFRSTTFMLTALAMEGCLATCENAHASVPVSIPDRALRGVLELALEKQPGEEITRKDLRSLSHLRGTRRAIVDLTGLQFASNLQTLDLGSNAISDISVLAHLSRLAEVRLPKNRISDLSPLSGLRRLSQLDLSLNLVSDLAPLAGLSVLAELNVGSNRITDISGLANLPALVGLDVSYNAVSDLSPLTALRRLAVLYINGNAVRDLWPIGNLQELTSLYFEGNLVEDLSPLAELQNLTGVRFAANAVSDLSALAGLGDLWYLNASNNRIADVSPIARLSGLTRLGLDFNEIEVLPEFDLPALRSLNISNNRISDLSPIASLSSLGNLIVSNNEVSDLSPLQGLSRLNILLADANRIADLSPLSDLTELDALYLHGNAVADLSPLAGLSGLGSLHLDGNEVSDLSPLADIEILSQLSLADNAISDLSPLSALPRIASLVLDYNDIYDLSPLAGAQSLGFLSVEHNAITDLSPLASGTALGSGDEARLGFNPLNEASLASHIPALVANDVWVSVRTGHVPLMVSPMDAERQSLVRVVNDSGADHLLDIKVRDAQGDNYVAVLQDGSQPTTPDLARQTLHVQALKATHFNSADFVAGNPRKGLPRGVGISPRIGDNWRLMLRGPSMDVEVLAYMRSSDGAVSLISGFVPAEADGRRYRLRIFNPASNVDQQSLLRLTNPGLARADVVIEGVDDRGESPGTPVGLRVRGLSTRTVTAAELETDGDGRTGALGDGQGKWRLTVASNRRLEVTNLLQSAEGGYLANLHSSPVRSEAGNEATTHFVPLFESSADSGMQAFARVINLSPDDGEARILAIDDAGRIFGPATLSIRADEVVQFSSHDLIAGDKDMGLMNGTGAPMGEGSWRLKIESSLEIEVLAFVRASGGFLANLSRATTGRNHRLSFFNPASNAHQTSLLRLANWGDSDAEVVIEGLDDLGRSGRVVLTMHAGTARALTSRELEAGTEGLTGVLGDGDGKWRLAITANQPIDAMSLVSSPSGRVTNLTTTP